MTFFSKRDIVEVVGRYVALEQKGFGDRPYHVGLCPFHDDKDPSLYVFEKVQRARCWSCWPEGGDVIDFVMKAEKCGFRQALSIATDDEDEASGAVKAIRRLAEPKPDAQFDVVFAIACKRTFDRLDFEDALAVHSEAEEALAAGHKDAALRIVAFGAR